MTPPPFRVLSSLSGFEYPFIKNWSRGKLPSSLVSVTMKILTFPCIIIFTCSNLEDKKLIFKFHIINLIIFFVFISPNTDKVELYDQYYIHTHNHYIFDSNM